MATERGARVKTVIVVGKQAISPRSAPKREKARERDRGIKARARREPANQMVWGGEYLGKNLKKTEARPPMVTHSLYLPMPR